MKKRVAIFLAAALLWAVMVFVVKRTGAKPEPPPSPVVPGCTFLPGPNAYVTPTGSGNSHIN